MVAGALAVRFVQVSNARPLRGVFGMALSRAPASLCAPDKGAPLCGCAAAASPSPACSNCSAGSVAGAHFVGVCSACGACPSRSASGGCACCINERVARVCVRTYFGRTRPACIGAVRCFCNYTMSYNIAGKKVLSEHLVLGVFGAIGGGAFLATRGGGKEAKPAPAPSAAENACVLADQRRRGFHQGVHRRDREGGQEGRPVNRIIHYLLQV